MMSIPDRDPDLYLKESGAWKTIKIWVEENVLELSHDGRVHKVENIETFLWRDSNGVSRKYENHRHLFRLLLDDEGNGVPSEGKEQIIWQNKSCWDEDL